jgi:hypothetical protein
LRLVDFGEEINSKNSAHFLFYCFPLVFIYHADLNVLILRQKAHFEAAGETGGWVKVIRVFQANARR